MGSKGLRYAIRDGFAGLKRHPVIIIISITTMLFMLALLSVYLLFAINANHALKKAGEIPPVEVQFAVGTSQDLVVDLANQFADNDNIVEYKVMSPEDNFQDFKERIGKAELFDEFDYNRHIPWTILLRLKNPELGQAFREEVMQYPGVYDVMMETALMESLERTIRNVSAVSLIVFLVLIVITVLVINNMIRVIALSRSTERYIMKTVGATDTYIRIPYIIEGFFVSFCAAALALTVSLLLYQLLKTNANISFLRAELLPLSQVAGPVIGIVLAFALLLGTITSALSVKRYIEV